MYGFRLTVSLVMVGVFLKLFAFFFKLKKAKLAKQRRQFQPYQVGSTLFIVFLVVLNTVAFILRGVSPLTNYSTENWMQIFDQFCIIYYSVNDMFTSLGITVMFFFIGRSEYENTQSRKFSLKSKEKLGHENFKKSDVDDGGDLTKLCEESLVFESSQ
jgi:hypothetical protein